MPTVLKALVQFVGLAPGVPTSLPHGLNYNGRAVVPDTVDVVVGPGAAAPSVRVTAADATNVTVVNTDTAAVSANVLCERWHTFERALPAGQVNLPVQPVIGAGGASAGSAQNVLVPDGGGATRTIFANATGNDSTGTGTAAAPYRTLRRALLDVPQFIFNETWVIDVTGLGTETSATPIEIARFGPDRVVFLAAPTFAAFFNRAPLTIEATPTTFDTLTAGEITSQTPAATTGLITVNTNQSYGLNALRGKKIVDANGSSGVIASNTAGPNSSIEVTISVAMTAPLLIVDPSATIVNSGADANGNPAIRLAGGTCPVVINGLAVSNSLAAGVFDSALVIQNNPGPCFLSLCDIPGLTATGPAGAGITVGSPEIQTCYWNGTAEWVLKGIGPLIANSFFQGAGGRGITTDCCGPGDAAMFWLQNIFQGMPPIGRATSGFDNVNTLALFLDDTIIRSGTSDGVSVASPMASVRLRDCDIHSCVGDGIDAAGGRVIMGLVTSVGGANGGVGLRLTNGSQASRGTATLTGAGGDYKVGGNAAAAGGGAGWAAFAGVGNETDVAAAAALIQLCRLFA